MDWLLFFHDKSLEGAKDHDLKINDNSVEFVCIFPLDGTLTGPNIQMSVKLHFLKLLMDADGIQGVTFMQKNVMLSVKQVYIKNAKMSCGLYLT